ncbi:MAG: response regulator transcription factor [Chloroflexi bacterium]|nr:response regulator transcription factor [Chloroflexota bacterium]
METVFVVDDEKNIRELIRLYLTNAGYQVVEASDGLDAMHLALGSKLDLILLDLMLPRLDGFEVCRRLRREGVDVPIIMLTARDDDIDKIVGLELGADDYVTKPFNPRELVARVKAVLRRTDPASHQVAVLQAGDLRLDFQAHQVFVAGQIIELRPKEFDLLAELLAHPNQALSREQLLTQVWGYSFGGDTRTVDVHIARLREHLAASTAKIETLWGVGYKLVSA